MSAPLYEDSRVKGFFMSPWRMGMPASFAEEGTVPGLEAEMMSWEGGVGSEVLGEDILEDAAAELASGVG